MSELPEDVKAQLEAQKAQCLFCKIVRGELDAFKIYEDEHILGILDINPAAKGHALFLPKEHYPILPLVPPVVFNHLFGKLPSLMQAMQNALVKTGTTVFIANGGAAGQQSPHFLIHVIPRENGDGINFSLQNEHALDPAKQQNATNLFAQNLPLMLANHFKRTPQPWHKSTGERGTLTHVTPVIYEDEKTLVTTGQPPQALGHLRVLPKTTHDLTTLDPETSAHLFLVSSYAATATFEGLQAHGSNIILRTGTSDDAPTLAGIDILARYSDDTINLHWNPLTEKPDLATLRDTLHDGLFPLAHATSPPTTTRAIPSAKSDPLDEVRAAIAELHRQQR